MSTPRTSRPLRDLALAVTLLTVVPLRARWPDDERPDVAGYFPAAGFLTGGAGALAIAGLSAAGGPVGSERPLTALLGAALVVCIWALLTRALHWDGLADVADGYWGGSDPGERLAIMSDPRTGAFGATAVSLVAIVQVAAVSVLASEGALAALACAPVIGRFAAVFGAWFGGPVRPHGLGASVAGHPRIGSLLFAGASLGAVAALLWAGGTAVWVAVGVAMLAALGVPHVIAARFGGVTGDVLGASVLLTETAALVLLALVS